MPGNSKIVGRTGRPVSRQTGRLFVPSHNICTVLSSETIASGCKTLKKRMLRERNPVDFQREINNAF